MLLELTEKEPFWIVLRGASVQNEGQPSELKALGSGAVITRELYSATRLVTGLC